MQFIDTVTPSSAGQYIENARNYPGSHISDFNKQAAGDWATMYYQNAYNTAVMNYMNEYNTPLQQMLRYQEAGINPFLASTDAGNMGSSHAGAAPKGNFVAPSSLDTVTKTMATVQNTIKAAADIYDYIKYGAPTEAQQKQNLQVQGDILNTQLRKYAAEADFAEWWNRNREYWPSDVPSPAEGSPRAVYMATSTDYKLAQIAQLEGLVKIIYPSQEEASKAIASLNRYRESVLRGQNDFVLDLNTGNDQADKILQALLLKLLSTNIGISGKMF